MTNIKTTTCAIYSSKQLLSYFQKQPSRGVLRKAVLEICWKFTGEHPCGSIISIELHCNFTEIPFRHGCSPVSLLHIFRTPFFIAAPMERCFSISNQPIIVFPSKHLLKTKNFLSNLKPLKKFIFFQQSLLK